MSYPITSSDEVAEALDHIEETFTPNVSLDFDASAFFEDPPEFTRYGITFKLPKGTTSFTIGPADCPNGRPDTFILVDGEWVKK